MAASLALIFLASQALASIPAPAIPARMARIALEQSTQMSGDWDPAHRDCAGFVRYVYRHGLGRGARMWLDRTGAQVDFVRANELLAYNFDPVSREVDAGRMRTGDLLAFYDASLPPNDAWHVMMVLRPPTGAPDRLLAVYHNGGRGKDGAVKKVWLDTLAEPAWGAFRPVASNSKFLGVFRWKGWTQ